MTRRTGSYIQQVLWPAQNSQSWHPLRPIVSSRGSITYGVAKELAYIKSLVGQSPHHLKNTHFVQHIQKARLEPGEVMTSYNVKAMFTSVPVDPSIHIVQHKLTQDLTLHQRTSLSIQNIVTLPEFCLKIHTSSSKVSIMNRYKALPWVPPLVPSLPTCSWKSLKSRPLALPLTHHTFA